MATFGTALRRGLPRRAGGDPWPPSDAAASAVVERAERDETPPRRCAPRSLSERRQTMRARCGVAAPRRGGRCGSAASGARRTRLRLRRTSPPAREWRCAAVCPGRPAGSRGRRGIRRRRRLRGAAAAASAPATPQNATPERVVAAATGVQVAEAAALRARDARRMRHSSRRSAADAGAVAASRPASHAGRGGVAARRRRATRGGRSRCRTVDVSAAAFDRLGRPP